MPDEKDLATAIVAAAAFISEITTGASTNEPQEQMQRVEQVENTPQQQNTTQEK